MKRSSYRDPVASNRWSWCCWLDMFRIHQPSAWHPDRGGCADPRDPVRVFWSGSLEPPELFQLLRGTEQARLARWKHFVYPSRHFRLTWESRWIARKCLKKELFNCLLWPCSGSHQWATCFVASGRQERQECRPNLVWVAWSRCSCRDSQQKSSPMIPWPPLPSA